MSCPAVPPREIPGLPASSAPVFLPPHSGPACVGLWPSLWACAGLSPGLEGGTQEPQLNLLLLGHVSFLEDQEPRLELMRPVGAQGGERGVP